MLLDFPNVTLLGINQESKFFDAGFNYLNTKNLTINGIVQDLANSFGISGVWTGVEGMISTVANNQNFNPVILNGFSFGSGRIQNYSFAPGNDVKTKTYTVTLEIRDAGNLSNFSGTYYSGINTTNWQYLNNFSESYNLNKKQNGGYGYTHTANIQFNSGVGGLNAIQQAKSLAKSLFTGSNLGFAFYSGYTNKIGKRTYTESYNLINNSCQFDENFNFDSDSGSYSVTRTNQFELSEKGIVTVSENGTLKGIVAPTYQSALNAINGELNQSYARCNEIFNLYVTANAYALISSPVSQNKNFDLFNNNLGYTVTYSNDITNSGLFFWDYSQKIDHSEGITILSEEGTINGHGINKATSFVNAKNGYSSINSSAVSRAQQFYIDHIGDDNFVFLDSRSLSFSPLQGLISYGLKYSNEQTIVGSNGIKRIDIKSVDDASIYSYSKFNIINDKEIAQDEQNASLGSQNLSLSLQGEAIVPLSEYLNNAKNQINSLLPSGIDPYVVNVDYSYSPNQNNVKIDIVRNFNVPAVNTFNLG